MGLFSRSQRKPWDQPATIDGDMPDYTPQTFTDSIADFYAEKLKERFPEAKFMMSDGDAFDQALRNPKLFRIVKGFEAFGSRFEIDNYVTIEGKIKAGSLVESVANALVQAVENVVQPELKPEREDDAKKIGAGELWVIHRKLAVVETLGAAVTHFSMKGNVGVFGQAWHDGKHQLFLAKAEWAVARHGEAQKENIAI